MSKDPVNRKFFLLPLFLIQATVLKSCFEEPKSTFNRKNFDPDVIHELSEFANPSIFVCFQIITEAPPEKREQFFHELTAQDSDYKETTIKALSLLNRRKENAYCALFRPLHGKYTEEQNFFHVHKAIQWAEISFYVDMAFALSQILDKEFEKQEPLLLEEFKIWRYQAVGTLDINFGPSN